MNIVGSCGHSFEFVYDLVVTMKKIKSKNNVYIRLTDERWNHIIMAHCELIYMENEVCNTVVDPDVILEGNAGALLAVKERKNKKYLVVIYREDKEDGFIITAFLTSKIKSLNRRTQLWPK